MLTVLPAIHFSYWSFVIRYINMISEFTIKKLDFVMAAKSIIEDIKVVSPIVINPLTILNKNENNNQESNLELFQWKLRKNLETLAFLAELESRYDSNARLPKFMDECFAVKAKVQQITVEITRIIAKQKNSSTKHT